MDYDPDLRITVFVVILFRYRSYDLMTQRPTFNHRDLSVILLLDDRLHLLQLLWYSLNRCHRRLLHLL